MQAEIGDVLVVESRAAELHRREGDIVEVHGDEGRPPYVVHWHDGAQGLVYPGPDAHVVKRSD